MKYLLNLILLIGVTMVGNTQSLKIDYLNQAHPGNEPKIFAPEKISSGYHERSLVFSPNGNELFYQLRGRRYTTFLLHKEKVNGKWGETRVADFSGSTIDSDDCPFFSPDGNTLYFASHKAIPGTTERAKRMNIWTVTKTDNGWTDLKYLEKVNTDSEEHYPSVAANGNLYFNSNRDGNYDIYKSEFKNGEYATPVRMDAPINSEHFEGHPYIAPDESYLIISSDRPDQLGEADIYISFRKDDNTWTEPLHMGNKINTKYHEVAPYVSPDGKYLFFLSFRYNPADLYPNKKYSIDEIRNMLDSPGNGNGDIYWMSADIIKELKQKALR